MWDQNSNRKSRVEKGVRLALQPWIVGRPGGMCTAGGRVREGKPSLVRTGMNVVQDAGRGAADLIASRIPPGRIDWVVGGRVVFFVLVVFSVFYVFVGLVAVLGCLLVVWLLGCWFEQPNNPKKQPPNNPIIRQPSYQTTQEHNNPTTQTNRFLTKKSKRQTTKNIRKSSQGDPNWSQN